MPEQLHFIDLFAGIGGFRLGMEQAGHKCVGWVESDPRCEKCKKNTKQLQSEKKNHTYCSVCGKEKKQHARISYEAIHNTKGEWTAYDITEVIDEQWRSFRGKVDILCGGFPCQSFSVAGKRLGFEDTRGTLFFEIARAAKQIKPRFLFLENVKGLLSHEKGKTFATILTALDELGYDAEWQVLNSKDFGGVPQNRERVFIIGHLRGTSRPEVFPFRKTDGNIGNEIKRLGHSRYFRRVLQTFDTDGSCEAIDTMQGGNRQPCVLIKGCSIRTRSYANQPAQLEVRKDDLSNTVTSVPKDTMVLQEPPFSVRKLTPRECWRLQSFPDWAFDKAQEVNSNSQLYKQAGNSVTVNVIYEIAKALK